MRRARVGKPDFFQERGGFFGKKASLTVSGQLEAVTLAMALGRVYTFENLCKEDKAICLDDGAHKIFYNAAMHAIVPSETLKSFSRFLAGSANDGSAFSGRLAAMVSHAKTNGQ